MSFQQGLSGLSAASKTLEAIGNNVANANTIGFKESQAIFSDVYAASLTGSGGSQIGIGTRLTQVAQRFTQGDPSGCSASRGARSRSSRRILRRRRRCLMPITMRSTRLRTGSSSIWRC
eukprot:gene19028-26959_t